MRVARALVWGGCLMLLVTTANAQTVTVTHTADYHDTYDDIYAPEPSWTGIWFIPPVDITYAGEYILDHTPYCRGSGEDWGWAHDLTAVEPADATGIASATLTIVAWDVDPQAGEDPAEEDLISAKLGPSDYVELGLLKTYAESPITVPWNYAGQPGGTAAAAFWSTTTFVLPAEVLDSMWANRRLDVEIDIDRVIDFVGHRVTLKHAALVVEYLATVEPMEPNRPVYRFWSPILRGHFYTAKESEKQKLIDNFSDVWTYEEIAYYVFPAARNPDIMPIYRFWSGASRSHFYTISEAERDKLINNYSSYWTYEGPVLYAHPVGKEPAGACPVYRFWSPVTHRHFYTSKESERLKLLTDYPDVWTFEHIAWYAYPAAP